MILLALNASLNLESWRITLILRKRFMYLLESWNIEIDDLNLNSKITRMIHFTFLYDFKKYASQNQRIKNYITFNTNISCFTAAGYYKS